MRQPIIWPIVLVVPLLVACRLNIEERPGLDAAPDGPPLPMLSCGARTQFPMNSVTPSLVEGAPIVPFAAAATDAGYFAFAVDNVGDVHGFLYAFEGDHLVPKKVDVPVFSGAASGGGVAAVSVGDAVMAAVVYAEASKPDDALGTALISRDASLDARGDPQMQAEWLSLDGSIARASDGTLAFLGAQQSSGDVTVKLVSSTGTDIGAPHVAIDRSERASFATITGSSTGFLVTWAGVSPPQANVHAEIFDKQLALTVPATTDTAINAGAMFAGDQPHAAYVAAADRYLFAWSFKGSTTHELWTSVRSVRDNKLAEITSSALSTHGKTPRVVAGKDDFLVVWQDLPSGLAAARVKPDGTSTSLAVTGGPVLGWDLVTRAGQPALMWLEGGAVPTLWLNPLCN